MISRAVNADLLAELPQRERDRVFKLCDCVTLQQDEILAQPGEPIEYIYFPIDSSILLLADVDRRDALGVGLIGSEGMLGTSLLLGVHTSPLRAQVQGGGSALRMHADEFQHARIETPALELLTRRYVHVLVQQLAQLSACAAFHVMDVRLACWLLMTHDRTRADRFYLTHDRLAHMLGVQRSGVTMAAGTLQSRKLITYARGHIAILDRKGLEHAACSCYQMMARAARNIHQWNGHHDAAQADDADIRVTPGLPAHGPRKQESLA